MGYFTGGANKRSWEFGYVEVSDWLILETARVQFWCSCLNFVGKKVAAARTLGFIIFRLVHSYLMSSNFPSVYFHLDKF